MSGTALALLVGIMKFQSSARQALLTLTVFFSSIAFSAPNAESELMKTVQAELSFHKVIRVGVANAPGMGHQSAASSTIARLRALGYRGWIDVVYQDNWKVDQQKMKLSFVLPPFRSDIEGAQIFKNEKLVIRSQTQLENDPELSWFSKNVSLAIVAGLDRGYLDMTAMNAQELMADSALYFQPLNWHGSLVDRHIEQRKADGTYEKTQLPELRHIAVALDLTDSGNGEEIIENSMAHGVATRQKMNGLKAIAKAVHDVQLGSIYGHGFNDPNILLKYLAGVARARALKPELFKKGIVLPIFNHLESPLSEVHNIERYPELAKGYSIIAVDDPALEQKLANLEPGEILAISVGKVSKPVIEWAYVASTFPTVVEGRNSIHLMSTLGKPYLPSTTSHAFQESYPFENIPAVAQSALDKLMFNYQDYESAVQAIGDFLVASLTPNSELQQVFKKEQRVESIESDALTIGLNRVHEIARPLRCEFIFSR
jgi:hypothetical protein